MAGRLRRQGAVPLGALAVTVLVVAALSGYVVAKVRTGTHLDPRPGATPATVAGGLPSAGAIVPAYDLWSDPVFPTVEIGYAIERHPTSGGSSEALARSEDGGRTWRLVGQFPFANGYSEVQFISVSTGYAFGPAGLAVTRDGGRTWTEGDPPTGRLQKVIPIGSNVWATYVVCHGPPEASTRCDMRLAISEDGGLHWAAAGTPSPLQESYSGGDILARDTLDKAYIVTYGVTGGGLAVTSDSGQTWRELDDPCAAWAKVDMAALSGGQLWMICGASRVQGDDASAKAAFRSHDGGLHWVAESYTGFGPDLGPLAASGPVGHLFYAGQLSQLATISPTRAWIGVSGVGVLVSSDSGRKWTLVKGMRSTGGDKGVGVTFNDARHGWAIEFRSGVWQTSDAVHWHLLDGD